MIDRIIIYNYRSIGEDVGMFIGPLTALVGPNASGKSNVADALRFLAESAAGSLSQAVAVRGGFRSICRWGSAGPSFIRLGLAVSNARGDGFWMFSLVSTPDEDGFRIRREEAVWSPTGSRGRNLEGLLLALTELVDDSEDEDWGIPSTNRKGPLGFTRRNGPPKASPGFGALPRVNDTTLLLPLLGDTPLAPLLADIRGIAIYNFSLSTLRAPQSPSPIKPMTPAGDNWASTLQAIDRSTWGPWLIYVLNRITGDIDGYRVTEAGGLLIPEFRHGPGGPEGGERWLAAAQESDGTLRVAAILTALFQEPGPSFIGFEEPELSVHPGALPMLFDFLNEASGRSHILFTTHSPDLIDRVPDHQIRVVERRAGSTTVALVGDGRRALVRKRLLAKAVASAPQGREREEAPKPARRAEKGASAGRSKKVAKRK